MWFSLACSQKCDKPHHMHSGPCNIFRDFHSNFEIVHQISEQRTKQQNSLKLAVLSLLALYCHTLLSALPQSSCNERACIQDVTDYSSEGGSHATALGRYHSAAHSCVLIIYEGLSKSFRTGHLERELQMVHLSAARCTCIAIL